MMTDYALMAQDHLRRHLPGQYAELTSDPEAAQRYFDEIGRQAASMVPRVERQTLASLPPIDQDDPAAVAALMARARATAEDLVLTELILVPEGETGSRTDADGAYLGWEPGVEPLLDDSTRLLH